MTSAKNLKDQKYPCHSIYARKHPMVRWSGAASLPMAVLYNYYISSSRAKKVSLKLRTCVT